MKIKTDGALLYIFRDFHAPFAATRAAISWSVKWAQRVLIN